MKAFLIFLVSAFIMNAMTSAAFAQNTHDEIIQRFLEQRKSMMEDIMKAFDDDEFFKDDFFQDDLFESLRQHGLGGFKGFSGIGNNISVEERMEKDGSISVIITPKDKNTDLNIETTDDKITIKSQVRVEDEIAGQAKSISMQSFKKSVSIPQGYTAKRPKKEGESIVISLVPQKGNILKPDNKGRVPIKKTPGQETI